MQVGGLGQKGADGIGVEVTEGVGSRPHGVGSDIARDRVLADSARAIRGQPGRAFPTSIAGS